MFVKRLPYMNRSEFIERMVKQLDYLPAKDIELSVKTIMEHLTESLASGVRIEIRGFGSFSLHHRLPRVGRNPKTGESVTLAEKYVPHFKPGKALRERVDVVNMSSIKLAE